MVALAPNTSETSSWDVLEGFPKLHSRAREVKTRICTEAPHSKSFGRVEIWLMISESCVGLESFTRDPIGLRGGPSQYNYVYASPLMYLDFNGEFGVKPIGQKWEVPDFFAWYYAGLGQDVDIAQVGLLIPWWNHIQPQVYNDLKRSLLPSLESQLDCISGKTSASIDISSKDTLLKEGKVCPGGIHTTAGGSVSDPLTVMGTSCVTFRAICKISIDCINCCDGSVGISSSKGSCDITFSVRDKFQNPLDVGGFFGKHDWPGSKPYGLNATWYHTWKWSNLYDPCNDDQ